MNPADKGVVIYLWLHFWGGSKINYFVGFEKCILNPKIRQEGI